VSRGDLAPQDFRTVHVSTCFALTAQSPVKWQLQQLSGALAQVVRMSISKRRHRGAGVCTPARAPALASIHLPMFLQGHQDRAERRLQNSTRAGGPGRPPVWRGDVNVWSDHPGNRSLSQFFAWIGFRLFSWWSSCKPCTAPSCCTRPGLAPAAAADTAPSSKAGRAGINAASPHNGEAFDE
jgi:hypothetical protein